MNSEPNVLCASFPRSMRGYTVSSVDEFVKDMGRRLYELQTAMEAANSECENLREELRESRLRTNAYSDREAALANAAISIEQHRTAVELQMKSELDNAATRAKQILDSATDNAAAYRLQSETDAAEIIADAKNRSEEMIHLADIKCRQEQERLRSLCVEYDATASRMRRTLEAQLSLLPEQGIMLSDINFSISATAAVQDTSDRRKAAA